MAGNTIGKSFTVTTFGESHGVALGCIIDGCPPGKEISKDEVSLFEENELLREWCDNQSQKFNDEEFNQLFYQQMSSAAKKLNSFSKSIKKNFKELDLEDLILLVQQDWAN